jgi:hypothetical protein
MLFSTLLCRLGCGRPVAGPARPRSRTGPLARRQSFVPRLEALEGRALPSTLTVITLQDSGAPSLRGAIAAAQSGDTIDFQPGLTGPILLGSTLVLTKNVTIQGNLDASGNPLVTVDGQHRVQDFSLRSGVTATLAGLGIANALNPAGDIALGGGIYNAGNLTIQSCRIAGNVAGVAVIYSAGTLGTETGEGGAIVIPKLVLPTLGRAAMIDNSPSCKPPPSIGSISRKPVGTPISPQPFLLA